VPQLNTSLDGAIITLAPQTMKPLFSYPPMGTPWNTVPCPKLSAELQRRLGSRSGLHPICSGKNRITSLIKQNYQESVIKQAMCGNLGTNMFKTYVVLSEQDIDAEFRERMGIQKKEIKEDKKMVPRQCKSCFAMNGPQSNFCHVCGKPLTGEVQKKVTNYRAQVQKLLSENPVAAAALVEAMMGLKPETIE
jgi:hypothetical protein